MLILATAAPGTAELLADECRELDLPLRTVHADGVELDLDAAMTARALVQLHLPGRLLLHVATARCDHANRMYHEIRALCWEDWLDAQSTFTVAASGVLPDGPENQPAGRPLRRERLPSRPEQAPRGPELRTHGFAAAKIREAVVDRMQLHLGCKPDVDPEDPDVRIVARFQGNQVALYLDLCGETAQKRGRKGTEAPAPLQAQLAAAIVRAAGYKGQRPLIDPMAGSGTLVVAAARRALGIAPNARRVFGVERWPLHGERLRGLLDQERAAAQAHEQEAIAGGRGLKVQAAELERSALGLLRRNVELAGLQDVVEVVRANARRLQRPEPGTLILTNPSYGLRFEGIELAAIYADLGAHFATFADCDAWVVASRGDFERDFGLRRAGIWCLSQGTHPIDVLHYRLGTAALRPLADDVSTVASVEAVGPAPPAPEAPGQAPLAAQDAEVEVDGAAVEVSDAPEPVPAARAEQAPPSVMPGGEEPGEAG